MSKQYNDYPTMEEIKKDYNELMEIIKNVRTIEQAREIQTTHGLFVEINGLSIDEFVNGTKTFFGRGNNRGTDKDIKWIRYENYGCLSYIYDSFNGKPMFDVYSNYVDSEFIRDITINELTEELYKMQKAEYTEY